MKRFYRCNVCGDIHYGTVPPKVCPTCNAADAYAETAAEEAAFVQEFKEFSALNTQQTSKESLLKTWQDFAKSCNLTDDEAMLDALLDGVLANEKKTGLRLCPCRIRDGSRKQDLDLLCPCNFYAQEKWRTKDECWCGLFKKKSKDN